VLNSSALGEKLISGLLHASHAGLIVEGKTGDGSVSAILGSAGEGEHDAFGDVVKLAVSLESNGLPLFAAENPVAHVVDGGIASGGS